MDHTQNHSLHTLRKTDLAFCLIFCVALSLGCLSLIVRLGTRAIMTKGLCPEPISKLVFFDKKRIQTELEDLKKPSVNWKKLYPLSVETEAFYRHEDKPQEVKPQSTEKRYVLQNTKLVSIIKQLDLWFERYFFLHDFFVACSDLTQDLLGVLHSNQIRLANGVFERPLEKVDVSKPAHNLLKFNEFLSQRGIPFLYVQAPYRIPPEVSFTEPTDFSNQNADTFLSLIGGQITYVDLRDEIKKAGMNHDDCFYITGDHWKPEAIELWASKLIAEKLNNEFQLGIDVETFNNDNFTFNTLQESFLKNYGKDVISALGRMEDSVFISPKENVSLEAEFYSEKNLQRKASGGFDILFFPDRIETEKTSLQRTVLGIYMDGNGNAFIKNNSVQNGLKILFLGDSFSNAIEPYLCLCVTNFDTLDLRDFTGSLSAFIDTQDYDACVMLVNPNSLGSDTLFDFR